MQKHFNIFILILIAVFIIFLHQANAQFVSEVFDYYPAPGQYTNTDVLGSPQAARSIIGTNEGLVSLGAFGGSIVLGFDQPVENDPDNPYGVDFTIYGNATSTWSEPGIVYVMKDENGNGEPDDTWYEIAGSDYYRNSTKLNYSVTYFNYGQGPLANVLWSDNQGASGIIPVNSFHQQPYYPMSDLFPAIPSDQWQLSGTCIAGNVDLSSSILAISYPRAFGYADNIKVKSFSDPMPDNPYTAEIEGSGGDAIDIGWAVNETGIHMALDAIDFVKIMTGMNDIVGWLGEVSTEVAGIRDVDPLVTHAENKIVVLNDLPVQVMVNRSLELEATLFESGIPANDQQLQWSLDNAQVGRIENAIFYALDTGKVAIQVQSVNDAFILNTHLLSVFAPGTAVILIESNGVLVNDKLKLEGKMTDQSGKTILGINAQWASGDESVFEIMEVDGQPFLQGKNVGEAWLYYFAVGIDQLMDSVLISVLPESEKKKVYITVKTGERTLIPRQAIFAERFDLTSFVDRNQHTYGVDDIDHVSLAHAIAALNNSSGLEVSFRDDEHGDNSLYLWRVPEEDGGSIAYRYGYGGSQESDAYRKMWVVSHNQVQYVNGLEKVELNNEDEILIYHVQDNSEEWNFTQMTSTKDSLKLNESTVVQLMEYTCSMDEARDIHVHSSNVLAYQQVNQTSNVDQKSEQIFTTDEAGQLLVSFEEAGEYYLTSVTDAVKLVVSATTGLSGLKQHQKIFVYPNPCNDLIWVRTPERISEIKLYNMAGVLVKHLYGEIDCPISLSSLPSGIYVLNVVSNSAVLKQKIIRQ